MNAPPPIICNGGCDVCRAYAAELGVPFVVPARAHPGRSRPVPLSAIWEPYDADPTMGRCLVCGEDGVPRADAEAWLGDG